MTLTKNIESQQDVLQIYRRRLAYHLEQQARLGSMAPFSLVEDIQNARDQIYKIKIALREWGVETEDHPNDIEGTETQREEILKLQSPRAKFLLSRLQFLTMLDTVADEMLDQHVEDLTEYVSSLEMGSYYAQKLRQVMYRKTYGYSLTPGDPASMQQYNQARAKHAQEYRETLQGVRVQVYALVDELLQLQ